MKNEPWARPDTLNLVASEYVMDKAIYHYVLYWVEQNLYTGASVCSLVNIVGYSRSKLESVFSQYSGMPLGKYIFRRRITRAAVILRMTTLPIMEVAMQFHYHSGQNFARAFRLYFGKSPSVYRNESTWNRSTLQMPLQYSQSACQAEVVDFDDLRFIFGERLKYKVGFGFTETDERQLINKITERIRKIRQISVDSIWITIAINGEGCVYSGRKGLVNTELMVGNITKNEINNGVTIQTGKYIAYCFKGRWEELFVFLRMVLITPLAGYKWYWVSNTIFMKVVGHYGDEHQQLYQIYIPVVRGSPIPD